MRMSESQLSASCSLRLALICAALISAGVALGGTTGRAASERAPQVFRNFGSKVPDAALRCPVPSGFAEIAADASKEWPGRYVINRALPGQADKFRKLGYVTYVASFTDLVFRDSVPRSDQLRSCLSLQATPGEMETGAFAIFALKALRGVRVTPTDFRDPHGRAAISASHAEIRSAFYMRRRVWGSPLFVVHPTILERRRALDIEPRQSQLYYVTVCVPAKALPGRYVSSLIVASDDTEVHSVKLELTVLPFTLKRPNHLHFFCYHDNDPAPFYKDFVAMRSCGMNSVMLSFGADPKVALEDGKPLFDTHRLDRIMTEYRRAGLTGKVVYNLALRQLLDLSDEQFMSYLRYLNARASQQQWPGFIWSVGDEDDAVVTSMSRARRLLSLVKQGVPQDLALNTIVFPENSEVYGNQLDIRIFSSYFDGSLIEKTRRAGNVLGLYNGTGAYEIDPRDNRFFWGLWAWRTGAEAVEQWVYQSTLYKPDQPFNDLAEPASNRGNCHSYCYPGEDGPLPTVGYYGIMEGVDDARYLYTLEQYCWRARHTRNIRARQIAEKAASYLSLWRGRIDLSPLPDRDRPPHFTIRREVAKVRLDEYDTLRRTVTDFIVRLRNELG